MEQVSQKLIGLRVRAAREALDWTQERLAQRMGINDRQTISDIEVGKRALKPQELLQICELFERDIDFFIDPYAVAGEAEFCWRVAPEVSQRALDKFEQRAGHWIGLLRWLRQQDDGRTSVLKRALRLSPHSSFEDAMEDAEKLVTELALAPVPTDNLVMRIEKDLDIPVLFVDMAPGFQDSISGATCHLFDLGAILINRRENEGRRFYNVAHEVFHALTWDTMQPDRRESNELEDRKVSRRIEQLADNFAAALLMPEQSVRTFFGQLHCADTTNLCEVAYRFRVVPSALAWRLYNLDLITREGRDALLRERWTVVSSLPKSFSEFFVRMLHQALELGRLSVRKAAKAIGVGLHGLVELFGEYELAAPFAL